MSRACRVFQFSKYNYSFGIILIVVVIIMDGFTFITILLHDGYFLIF